MNLHHPAPHPPLSLERHQEANTRLHGRWLFLARIMWFIITGLVLGIFIASIPTYFTYLHVLTTSVSPRVVQLTHGGMRELQVLGLSVDFYAIFIIVINALFAFGFWLVGAVLFWRKADVPLALFASFALVAFPIGFIPSQATTLPSVWWFSIQLVSFLAGTSLSIFFYLFPSGQFVPHWSRWLIIGWVIYEGFERFFTSSFEHMLALGNVLFFALLASVIAVQIYRYRRVSNQFERQQTKWVVFGSTIGILSLIGASFVSGLFPVFFQPGTLAFFVFYPILLLSPLCIPISIGIAILRSRLWEIDVLINRTLVYGTLTVLLALVYVGLVIGLQSLVHLFTGQAGQSPIVIVASTLAIAALFQPLRHRLQKIVDRRFYRSKYDAAKIVEAFSATLRNELDLTELSEHLINVVQETMQPAHVSLWLRKSDHERKSDTLK